MDKMLVPTVSIIRRFHCIPKCALFSIILLALFSPSVIVVQLKICDIIERNIVVESCDVLFNNNSSWLSDVACLQLKPKVFG